MPGQAEIRLSPTSYAVLGLVRVFGEATPYDLKRWIGNSIENFWPVPHTTSYAEPERLARGGYLVERRETEGRRRRRYQITERGLDALQEWVNSPELGPPQVRDEATLKVFLGADPATAYAQQIEWARAKLEELEGYLGRVTAGLERGDQAQEEGYDLAALEGVRASLIFGTSYFRKQIELLEEMIQLSASSRPTISSA